ncbi:hypothetical protein ACFX10_017890 [Malus domestica]
MASASLFAKDGVATAVEAVPAPVTGQVTSVYSEVQASLALSCLILMKFSLSRWPDNAWSDPLIRFPEFHPISTVMIWEIFPLAKFSSLANLPELCVVCLYEFESEDEIRQLTNCSHVFHKGRRLIRTSSTPCHHELQ